ncbi:hypothetical protein WN093_15300 [Gammaproteobacteria bacterium AS21]
MASVSVRAKQILLNKKTKCLVSLSAAKQSGQAIVLVLLLSVVGVLGAVMLVSTGVLTSDKMQLQNAADATAYSISVLEARDLNYGAYMNRAMVANEVGIGQMVSLYSWAHMLKSEPIFLDQLAAIVNVIPIVGQAISGGLKSIAGVLKATSTPVYNATNKLTPIIIKALSILNSGYSLSQKVMHYSTLIFSLSVLKKVPEANMYRNSNEVDISSFGKLALAVHYAGYYADTIKLGGIFAHSAHPSNTDEQMSRFAQVVNDSRDTFTRNRGCENGVGLFDQALAKLGGFVPTIKFPGIKITPYPPAIDCQDGGGWDLNLFGMGFEGGYILRTKIPLLPDIAIGAIVNIEARIETQRKGGSQLAKVSNGYAWSSADVANITPSVKGSFEACFGFDFTCISGGVGFSLPVPFGAGAGLAGIKAPSLNGIDGDTDVARDIKYGGASEYIIPWNYPLLGVKMLHGNSVNKEKNYRLAGYKGLGGSYQMVNNVPNIGSTADKFIGMEAPYLLIGLVKGNAKDSPLTDAKPTGRFALQEADTHLAAIAKSQVYYSQPTDLSYFSINKERDGKPNGFNPYWDARLVDTSYIDRIAALTLQSEEIFLPGEIQDMINSLKTLVGNLGAIFS